MKSLKFLFTVVLIAFFFVGCKYDFIVPEEIPVIDPDDPNAEQISFSSDIVPIFESKCTACHTTGKQRPDLSAANAYSSLNSTRYLNSSDAELSFIYTKPNPDASGTHQKYSAGEAALVLGWIQQGAKNN
jgi:hypothetical protein